MSVQPTSDQELDRVGTRQGSSGWRFLLIGAALLIPGLLLIILAEGFGNFVGLALSALSAPPLVAGLALLLSGLVARWSARQRPYA